MSVRTCKIKRIMAYIFPWQKSRKMQSEIKRILGKVDELAESDEEINSPFLVTEAVKVIDGPFNGFTGIIEEVNEEKKKLKVMVKIFGRKTPLELSFMQVEKE